MELGVQRKRSPAYSMTQRRQSDNQHSTPECLVAKHQNERHAGVGCSELLAQRGVHLQPRCQKREVVAERFTIDIFFLGAHGIVEAARNLAGCRESMPETVWYARIV